MLLSWYYRLPHAVRWHLAPLWSPRSVARLRRECRETDGLYHGYVRRQAIFIHIPKCAGNSVKRVIYGKERFAHRDVRDLQRMFSPQDFSRYLKFTVVRNPWDRVVSAWHYLRSQDCPPGDQQWAAQHLSPYADFGDFVRNGLWRPEIRAKHHFRPQVSYLRLPGQNELLVDHICRVETLQQDLDKVLVALGLPKAPLNRDNASIHHDYRAYYDEQTRAIVAEHYREDIAAFGYGFEPREAPP
ncbi:MAG: sulfotransferase family 2 domain-containing protein [Solimonas sp.]